MLRFVGGRYDMIWGGDVASIAHILSGGIFDFFYTEKTRNNTPEHPDSAELFAILEQALKQNNLMSCSAMPPKHDPERRVSPDGIYLKHEFTITDVLIVKQTRILKIHNPHNKADQEIKQ